MKTITKAKKLSIRISEENLAAIHELAGRAKLTLTDYVTRACLGNRIVVIDGLDELLREQKAIGRNLNQLTTLCNMGKLHAVSLDELKNQYAALNETLAVLLRRRR